MSHTYSSKPKRGWLPKDIREEAYLTLYERTPGEWYAGTPNRRIIHVNSDRRVVSDSARRVSRRSGLRVAVVRTEGYDGRLREVVVLYKDGQRIPIPSDLQGGAWA